MLTVKIFLDNKKKLLLTVKVTNIQRIYYEFTYRTGGIDVTMCNDK